MSASRTPTEFLSFPVCGDCGLDFVGEDRKPMLLPCQHAFCRSCLNDQEDNDCQNCPTCRESWSGSNVTKLPVVYDLIPPGEDGTGREVVPDARSTSSASRDDAPPTGREVTPMDTSASRGRSSGPQQDRSTSSARFPICTICNEDFNKNSQRPLKLPCGHCFCQSCLEALRNSCNSTCPKCRGEWRTCDMNKLPIVKSLIHPSNADNNIPRAPSAAAGYRRASISDEQRLKSAEALRLRNNTQTRQTKNQICIKDTQNRTHTVIVDLQRDTVTQLRTLVQQVTGVQPEAQRLLHNSRQLEDGYTLAHYGIRTYDTITLTCRLRGGAV